MKRVRKPRGFPCFFKCDMFAVDSAYVWKHDGEEWVLWSNNPGYFEAVATYLNGAAKWLRYEQRKAAQRAAKKGAKKK